jgi:hypothetical protein
VWRSQISVFFSKAKTAMVLGVAILFGSIFPYIGVVGNTKSYQDKVGVAVCVPPPSPCPCRHVGRHRLYLARVRSCQVAASICPSTAFALGLDYIALYESAQQARVSVVVLAARTVRLCDGDAPLIVLQSVTSANASTMVANFNLSISIGMMVIMGGIFLVLTWYFDNIMPTEYGVPMSPFFPVLPSKRSLHIASSLLWTLYTTAHRNRSAWRGVCDCSGYWRSVFSCCCRRIRARKPLFTSNAGTFTTDPLSANSFIEASDTHQQQLEASNKCVKISGLRKEFTTGCLGKEVKVAVDGADMTFYEGSINILLGHNGAGTVS